MVAPVLGPYEITEDYTVFYRRRQRYKQTKPYTLPMPYLLLTGRVTAQTGNLVGTHPAGQTETLWQYVSSSSSLNQARIQSYEKFKAKLSDRASMGENLLSINKSLETIATRGMQLFNFTKAVKRGHFGQAAAILRTPLPRKKHPVKEQANNWLEFHLGIEPVVKDIYSAIDLLQEPIKNVHVKAFGEGSPTTLTRSTTTSPWSANMARGLTYVGVKYQADVAISNPNLYLANALGVVNPAVVLWQLAPMSFVLDWFVNVEQFLGTGSDFWGLTVLNASTTTMWAAKYEEWWNTYGWVNNSVAAGMRRELGITLPSLGLRPYKATSWQRGLTAISLLVPQLRSLKLDGYDASIRDKAAFRRRVNDSINTREPKRGQPGQTNNVWDFPV